MEPKKKKCKSCKNTNYIKGYGLCEYCYGRASGMFLQARNKKTTQAKTLRQFITNTKPFSKDSLFKPHHSLVLDALHAKLWKLTSKYVRLKGAIDGENQCYTCISWDLWTNLDAGHFIHKSSGSSVYYEHDFIKPQCKICNQGKDGQPEIFERKLRLEFGDEEIDSLIYRSKQMKKWTEEELKSMIKNINSLLNKLQ